MEPNITITYLTGEMKFVPPRYWIQEKSDGFYLNSEFMSTGPFETAAEITMSASAAGITL